MICPKCNKRGSLTLKKNNDYRYWYTGHYRGHEDNTIKVKWCYIGKELPEELKRLIE